MTSISGFYRLRVLLIAIVLVLCGCASEQEVYNKMDAQQIYEQGKAAALRKNYQQAIKDFDALEARFPYGEYTDKAQLALIHAYANSDDDGAALAAADRFIRVHPRHPNVDFAYYMKGVIYFDENFSLAFRNLPLDRSMRTSTHAQEAFDSFKLLLEKFPNSIYAADARKRMILLREQLSDHELHITRFYVAQGADLAAANRAAYLLNQFPQTTPTKEALQIMVKSYQDMGMTQQAHAAQEMLRLNFPENAG